MSADSGQVLNGLRFETPQGMYYTSKRLLIKSVTWHDAKRL